MLKKCPQCGKFFSTHSSKKKFCSMKCYRTYREEHADRSEHSRRARRSRLIERYVRGYITREEYEAERKRLKKKGLI